MRRFYGFLCMLLTLLVVVVFNIQSIYNNNNLSLEYSISKEAVIEVDKRENGIELTKEDIANKVNKRLDLAGANNSKVEIVIESESKAQIRVSLSTNTDAEFNNIIRVVKANTNLTFSNSNDNVVSYSDLKGSEDDTVQLSYQDDGVTPVVKYVIGNISAYNNFISQNDSISDENLKKNIYVWENKTEDDTYEKAFGTDKDLPQVKKKVIATLSTDSYTKADNEDVGYITVSNDEDGNAFTIASARSYVASRNADDYGFNVTYLYENDIPAMYDSNARLYLVIGVVSICLVISLILIFVYRLAGLTAALSTTVSTLLTISVADFVGFIFTPASLLSLALIFASASFVLFYTFKRIKNEYKKGKSLDKSHYEGFRKGFIVNLTVNGFLFVLALIVFFVGKEVIKSFAGFIVIGSVLNFVLSFYLTKWQTYYLVTSPVTSKHENLIGFSESKENKIENKQFVNVKKLKSKKKVSIAVFFTSVVIILATFLTFGLIKGGNNLFNYANDYKSGYRIDIMFVTNRDIPDSETFVDYNTFIEYLSNDESTKDSISSSDVKSYTFNRLETYDDNRNETYTTYISLDLNYDLSEEDNDNLRTFVESGFNRKLSVDVSKGEVSYSGGEAYKGEIIHDNFYFYLTTGLIVVSSMVLYLIVYGLYASLASTLLLSLQFGLGLALLSLTSLPFSSFTQFGVLFALLLSSISLIPVFTRYRELKKDEKAKRAPIEVLGEIFNRAISENYLSVCFLSLSSLVSGIVMIFAAEGGVLFSAGIIAIIISLINLLYITFLFGYDYINCKNDIYLKPINIKHKSKKAIEINKNEPQETIIPGIND
mgnify:FL=1